MHAEGFSGSRRLVAIAVAGLGCGLLAACVGKMKHPGATEGCMVTNDCLPGHICASDGVCRMVCNSPADCPPCDTCASGFCEPVAGCDPLSGTFPEGTACASSGQCDPSAPICDHTCRACASDGECELRYTDLPYCSDVGQCVVCLEHVHCTEPAASICDDEGLDCRGCESHAECAERSAATPVCFSDDGICGPPPGAGESCADAPCADGLKCDIVSSICCSELSSAPCCSAANTSACLGNLDCDFVSATCYESCFGETANCRQPSSQYCLDGTSCVPKKENGAECEGDYQCQIGHCECSDADCTTRVCNEVPCPICTVANSTFDGCDDVDQYVDTPDCNGDDTCNGSGECLKKNGLACTDLDQCASSFCEPTTADPTVVGDSKICNSAACATCRYANSNGSGCSNYAYTATGVRPPGCTDAWKSCNGSGSCGTANMYTCTAHSSCSSGNCICAKADCSLRRCNHASCGGCKYEDGGTTASRYQDSSCTSSGAAYGNVNDGSETNACCSDSIWGAVCTCQKCQGGACTSCVGPVQ